MKSRIRLEVRLHGQPDGVEAEALASLFHAHTPTA
jgi:hypothetical protein